MTFIVQRKIGRKKKATAANDRLLGVESDAGAGVAPGKALKCDRGLQLVKKKKARQRNKENAWEMPDEGNAARANLRRAAWRCAAAS